MESDSGRAAKATIDALCTLTPNSIGAIWVYQPASVPLEVYPELGERSDELLRQVYKLGMYAVDPVFSAFRKRFTGCASIYELMPRGFEGSEYWSRFYASHDIVDQLIHFVPLTAGRCVLAALHRTAEFGRFSDTELANQRSVFPVLAAAVRRFDPFHPPADREDLAVRIESGLENFGVDVLTEREREVVAQMIQGHNTDSVAHQLGLSPDRVRLHRRKAYVKLRVRSQGELFYCFLESLR